MNFKLSITLLAALLIESSEASNLVQKQSMKAKDSNDDMPEAELWAALAKVDPNEDPNQDI